MNTYSRESHTTYPIAVDSRIQALMFSLLNSDGSNFLEWINDARIVLNTEDLARTLNSSVTSTSSDSEVQIPTVYKWQVLSLLRRHLDHAFRLQYLEIEYPAYLWAQLYARFYHQQTFFSPTGAHRLDQLAGVQLPRLRSIQLGASSNHDAALTLRTDSY